MNGILLKLSYNSVGEQTLIGGICGGFFLGREDMAVTAYHLLSLDNFKPNDGYNFCQFWLIIEPNIVIELQKENLIEFPELDTTLVRLQERYPLSMSIYSSELTPGLSCHNDGFGTGMPEIECAWSKDKLIITSCVYKSMILGEKGFVRNISYTNVNAADVKLENIRCIECSYGGRLRMSGGPLINSETNEIIGMMSFALPADTEIKEKVFAIDAAYIQEKINSLA